MHSSRNAAVDTVHVCCRMFQLSVLLCRYLREAVANTTLSLVCILRPVGEHESPNPSVQIFMSRERSMTSTSSRVLVNLTIHSSGHSMRGSLHHPGQEWLPHDAGMLNRMPADNMSSTVEGSCAPEGTTAGCCIVSSSSAHCCTPFPRREGPGHCPKQEPSRLSLSISLSFLSSNSSPSRALMRLVVIEFVLSLQLSPSSPL